MGITPRNTADKERLTKERDLFLGLLNLAEQPRLAPFLKEALKMIREATGSDRGYLELYDDEANEPKWWSADGFPEESDLVPVRQACSKGVISQSIAMAELIVSTSLQTDERFSDRKSVQGTHAILCAPIGVAPPLGILYLKKEVAGRTFKLEDETLAETFGRHVAPFVKRLLREEKRIESDDPTRPYRDTLDVDHLVGRSPAMAKVLNGVLAGSRFDTTNVLLTGPSGSGKTAVARAIHDNSPRKNRPFIELNCATIPKELFESELFGVAANAVTGVSKRMGKFGAAEGGTLFLDEIGELPFNMQAKLLQILQSGRYFSIGDNTEKQADVRIITATNADLKSQVQEKQFREDLFFRINVFPIRMPDLSERTEDIPLLAKYLVESLADRHGGLKRIPLSPRALVDLTTSPWPGNVRQIENLLHSALVRASAEDATQIESRHIFEDSDDDPTDKPLTYQEATKKFQKNHLLETLVSVEWNVTAAAKQLDLTRAHVYSLINRLNISRPKRRGEN